MTEKIIEISNGLSVNPELRLKSPVYLDIFAGEHIAVVGDNGSGKTLLVEMIAGVQAITGTARCPVDRTKYITFRDSYGPSDAAYYHQQRWNQTEMDEVPTVGELIDEVEQDIFVINRLRHKRIVMLSSGELRKFQLTKALLSKPRVLIIDNPFIGLDVHARKQLHELLCRLAEKTDILIIVVVSRFNDIPDFITHVVPVVDREVKQKTPIADYAASLLSSPPRVLTDEQAKAILNLPYSNMDGADGQGVVPSVMQPVVQCNSVHIRYGERTILKDLSFTVRNGEHWALTGDNGSGKSTLLSIICADNPQSYANDVVLFGKRRGTGESIWDIKKNIGYISPEMYRAYRRNMPSIDIVASGFSDTVGLYRKPDPKQRDVALFWMDIFGISRYRDTSFMKLSSGEQRLVLLARAFVKDPLLLILDEPLHGLDSVNRRLVKDVIELFCMRRNKTLIMVTHYEEDLPHCIDHRLHLEKNN